MNAVLPVLVSLMVQGPPVGELPPERIALFNDMQKFAVVYEIGPNDSELQKLQKMLANTAAKEWELRSEEFRIGRGTLNTLVDAGHRLLEAKLALAKPNEVKSIYETYVLVARWNEALNKDRFDAGAILQRDFEQTRFDCLDAQIQLVRAGGTVDEPKIDPRVQGQIVPQQQLAGLPEFVQVKPFIFDAGESQLKQLLKLRANCAMTEARLRTAAIWNGNSTLEIWIDACRRARDSRLALASVPAERQQILSQYHQLYVEFRRLVWVRDSCVEQKYFELLRHALLTAQIDHLRTTATADELAKVRANAEPDGLPDPSGITTGRLFTINDAETELQRLPKERTARYVKLGYASKNSRLVAGLSIPSSTLHTAPVTPYWISRTHRPRG